MDIPLKKLNYSFSQKPLLVGGMAMEYYGLRKSGKDIDLIAPDRDIYALIQLFPHRVKELWGDLGVCPFEFEIWKTICHYDYNFLRSGAIEEEGILIISLEKLLLMKVLAMGKEKYFKDTQLIAQHLSRLQGKHYDRLHAQNTQHLKEIDGIVYIEKTGPER